MELSNLAAAVAPRLLSVAEVSERTSLSRTTIYRRVGAGTFPKPARIGEHRIAWPEPEIASFITSAIAGGAQ